jgi:hypothetical protein
MASWSKLVDMEMDDEASMDAPQPIAMAEKPRYPYGLRICLGEGELKKLDLDLPNVGDVIDLRAFAEVTSVSDGEGGRRVELVIQKLAVENEMTEDEKD